MEVHFKDGTSTGKVSIDYPIGHRKRRAEGIPVLMAKFEAALCGHLGASRVDTLIGLVQDPQAFDAMGIDDLLSLCQG